MHVTVAGILIKLAKPSNEELVMDDGELWQWGNP
jgi:hypothetical protein